MLVNKLGITSEVELFKEEERITKIKALELFDTKKINEFEIGTTKGLWDIHLIKLWLMIYIRLQAK